MAVERIVVVGCGSIGRRHACQLIQRTDVALELCDVVEENLAKTLETVGDVPIYRSFDEMLRTRPDMVIVATPPALHAEQTIAALRSGIHVLCEKPMSDSLADAQRMVAEDSRSDAVLDIGFVLHFDPGVQAIKKMLDSGRFGKPLHVHWHIGTYETLFRSVSRHQAETYGALVMDYAHQPDLLFWWFGLSPTIVHAVGHHDGDLPLSSNPNFIALTLQYESSLLATMNLNYVQHPGRAHCEIVCERAWMYFDMTAATIKVGQRESGAVEETSVPSDVSSIFEAEHQAFLDTVHGLRKPESPSQRAIQSMFVVDAAIRSLCSKLPASVAVTCQS